MKEHFDDIVLFTLGVGLLLVAVVMAAQVQALPLTTTVLLDSEAQQELAFLFSPPPVTSIPLLSPARVLSGGQLRASSNGELPATPVRNWERLSCPKGRIPMQIPLHTRPTSYPFQGPMNRAIRLYL